MSLARARLGAYEILAPIGAGGMGEVYRACDTKLGREVVLNVLPAERTILIGSPVPRRYLSEFCQSQVQVPFVHRNETVQTLPANLPNEPFAVRIRRGSWYGRS